MKKRLSVVLGILLISNFLGSADATVVSEPEGVLAAPSLRRLTEAQYSNIVADVFGSAITLQNGFDAPLREDGLLAVGSRKLEFSPARFERALEIGRNVARQVTSQRNRDFLIGCKSGSRGFDRPCVTKFFNKVAPLLLRIPVSSEVVQNYVDIAADAASQLGDPYKGIEQALTGLLVSPQFLYISEVAGTATNQGPKGVLDPHSLASRISFFLWNSGPDEELLRASSRGDLDNPEKRAAQVERMLKSPRFKWGVRAFFEDMLHFDYFAQLTKDPVLYPAVNSNVIIDLQEQVLRSVVEHIATRDADYRELFTTRQTFMTRALGPIYRLPISGDGDWVPYVFPEQVDRQGIQSLAGFLALNSHPGRSSPTLRGKALREVLLCQKVPEPPGNVSFDQFNGPDAARKTARQRLTLHNQNPVCAGCHKITDPMGFALENFDGAGQHRDTDGGLPLDLSGELDGKRFSSNAELGRALSESKAATSCLVRRMLSYATGYAVGTSALVPYFHDRFAENNYRIRDLMRAIVLSNSFRFVAASELQSSAL